MSERSNQTAVVSEETGEVICSDCTVADRAWTRLRGLLGRSSLAPGEGLILSPAFAIHTFFMRFPIDAVFVDGEGTIVSVRPHLRPWRGAAARSARAVLELAAGQSGEHELMPGERLRLVSTAGPDVDGGTEPPW